MCKERLHSSIITLLKRSGVPLLSECRQAGSTAVDPSEITGVLVFKPVVIKSSQSAELIGMVRAKSLLAKLFR
jgi:hypothetical protein